MVPPQPPLSVADIRRPPYFTDQTPKKKDRIMQIAKPTVVYSKSDTLLLRTLALLTSIAQDHEEHQTLSGECWNPLEGILNDVRAHLNEVEVKENTPTSIPVLKEMGVYGLDEDTIAEAMDRMLETVNDKEIHPIINTVGKLERFLDSIQQPYKRIKL
jgi:hypothetical protein